MLKIQPKKRTVKINFFTALFVNGKRDTMMLKKDLYAMRFAILIFIVYSIFMQIQFHTICPFKALTDFPCPACGLTHATIYLFTGNFRMAFSANPTVLLWLTIIFLFGWDRYIHPLNMKMFPYGFIVVGIITFAWYGYTLFHAFLNL